MSAALWITQCVLAALFVTAGAPKLLLPKERLERKMSWTKTAPASRVKLLGLAELLGAAGLVLPEAVGIATFLTPVAAGCLFVLLLGAVATKIRRRESPALPIVAAIAALSVVVGRCRIAENGTTAGQAVVSGSLTQRAPSAGRWPAARCVA